MTNDSRSSPESHASFILVVCNCPAPYALPFSARKMRTGRCRIFDRYSVVIMILVFDDYHFNGDFLILKVVKVSSDI